LITYVGLRIMRILIREPTASGKNLCSYNDSSKELQKGFLIFINFMLEHYCFTTSSVESSIDVDQITATAKYS